MLVAKYLKPEGNPVRVFEEEGNCIVCLEIRADELIRHLISGELTNYRVVRTSPEPLQIRIVADAGPAGPKPRCSRCAYHSGLASEI
jgi:hypothetical protein